MTVLPPSKGAREIETLRFKMEEKIEEIEAGYDTLIEMQPEEERKYLEKKAGISDEVIQTHARILPALAKCPSEVTVNRTHQGGDDKDPQVRIRESLKPDKLKLDFSPMEYRRWTAQVKTFFAASNLQYVPYQGTDWIPPHVPGSQPQQPRLRDGTGGHTHHDVRGRTRGRGNLLGHH